MVVECWTFTADVELDTALRGNAEGWLWRLTLVALSRTHKFSLAFSTMRSCGREGELFVSLRTKSLRSSAVWDANCVVSGLYLISPSPAKSRRNGQMKKNLHSIRALFIYSFHKRFLNNFNTSLISLKRGFRASLWKKKDLFFFQKCSCKTYSLSLPLLYRFFKGPFGWRWKKKRYRSLHALLWDKIISTHTVHEYGTIHKWHTLNTCFANLQSPPSSFFFLCLAFPLASPRHNYSFI